MNPPAPVPAQTCDRHLLRDLVLRYAQAGDRRRFEAFRSLFTADGRVVGYAGSEATGAPRFSLEGADAIVAGMRGLTRYGATFHLVGNQLVEIAGDEASGETYCVAHHFGDEADGTVNDLVMYIRYRDRYAREGGVWRFRERVLLIDRQGTAALRVPQAR